MDSSLLQDKYVNQDQFKQILEDNKILIHAFTNSILEIKDFLTGPFLFLLTDEQGILLAMDYSDDFSESVKRSPIRPGMFFTEQSLGKNAISQAMLHNAPVYFRPEEHESEFFNTWHCYSTPLAIDNKNIGYLDVSTINVELQTELIAITKLLPEHLLNRYKEQFIQHANDQQPFPLTDRQVHVLKLIAQGHTIKSIANELNIKECTVNHHKKIIFEKLGVQSSTEAVLKAVHLSYF